MRRPLIIEPFGRMCHDLPKDGSHFLSQVNSKHHSEAFRHLARKTAIVAWTSQQHPANTRSRWSIHFWKEMESLARGHC